MPTIVSLIIQLVLALPGLIKALRDSQAAIRDLPDEHKAQARAQVQKVVSNARAVVEGAKGTAIDLKVKAEALGPKVGKAVKTEFSPSELTASAKLMKSSVEDLKNND